jgi:Protein of unknown function (DUF3037)
MPEAGLSPFSYAVLRVVPRVDRGERFNVGVVLYCRQRSFLGARVHLHEELLAALAPDVEPGELRGHLEALVRVAAGQERSGPIAVLPQSDRFGWLVAASSTMIQPSEVHTGLCEDPAATLDQLFEELVGQPGGR